MKARAVQTAVLLLTLSGYMGGAAHGQDSAHPESRAWTVLRPGLEFTFLAAERTVRFGEDRLACLRVDPERFCFKVLVEPQGGESHTAQEWRRRSNALAVFNAGQYTPGGTYLGLLVRDGRQVGHLASQLEALFVSAPRDASLPGARVIDLRYTAFDPKANPYRQAAQSLMLLDRFGHIRVRRSARVAHRTLVAQDRQGRILVLVSEGGHTLWELASFLKESGLGLLEVMCMDGGPESQLVVQVDDFAYSQVGRPSFSQELVLPWPTSNLPAALGIFPAPAPRPANPAAMP